MNVNNYVNKIVRKIKCSTARRKEIRKQLQMDIELRMQQGESLEQIMSQMGDIKEIADSFNENISAAEKKKYTLKKILTIVAVVVVFAAVSANAKEVVPIVAARATVRANDKNFLFFISSFPLFPKKSCHLI